MPPVYVRYLYEFIGTFFLVFTVGMSVFEPCSAGVFAPLAIGSVLAVMIYAGGHVSGGHYNPGVSLAVYLRGRLSCTDLCFYWAVQLLAGVVAAYTTIYFKGTLTHEVLHLDMAKVLLAEFLFSFALCYVVLNTATVVFTTGNSFFGFAIGFTVLAGALTVGPISGGAFNSAVALGLSVLKLVAVADLWMFVAANLVGGACAAWVFELAHSEVV